MRLELKTVEDVDRYRSKLQGLKIQFPGFREYTTRKLANDIILYTIHGKMKANNFSQKIIDGTVVSKISFTSKNTKVHFRSVYFSDASFDVALARERGTKSHSIDAPEPTPERPNPHLVFEISGKKIFAKHVEVKAIPALFIIHTTISQLREEFNRIYQKTFVDWYVANMGGLVVAS